MGLFSDDKRISQIHKLYQSLVAYEEGRIHDLEEFLYEKMGLEITCDDDQRRMIMLYYAINEGFIADPYASDVDGLYYSYQSPKGRMSHYLDYNARFEDRYIDAISSVNPIDYKIEKMRTYEDDTYEKENASLGLKALVKIGNICYRKTESTFDKYKIDTHSLFERLEQRAYELELQNILLTYYCRLIDGTHKEASDAAWRSVCERFGLSDKLHKVIKFYLYNYTNGYKDDLRKVHLKPNKPNSKLNKLEVDLDESYEYEGYDDNDYEKYKALVNAYRKFIEHDMSGCFDNETCNINNDKECTLLRKIFIAKESEYSGGGELVKNICQDIQDLLIDTDSEEE